MEPTPVVRAVTYERDRHKCVSCAATTNLQYQHRRATGMGGSKTRPRYEDGLTSCAVCNPAYEAALQTVALRYGWKLRSWVQRPDLVPVFVPHERSWFLLETDGRRFAIAARAARKLMVETYGSEYEEWEKAA